MHTESELTRRAKQIMSSLANKRTQLASSELGRGHDQELEDLQLLAAVIESRTSVDRVDDEVLERWDAAFGMETIANLVRNEHFSDKEQNHSGAGSASMEAPTASTGSPLSLPPEFWNQFQQCITAAINHSQDDARKFAPKSLAMGDNAQRPGIAARPHWYASAAALVACALSIAASWLAISAWQTQTNVRSELLAIRQSLIGGENHGTGIQVTSDKRWRITSWNEIWNNNVSESDSDKHNLDRLRVPDVLPPELTKLIELLESKRWSDAEIMACLRLLMAKHGDTHQR